MRSRLGWTVFLMILICAGVLAVSNHSRPRSPAAAGRYSPSAPAPVSTATPKPSSAPEHIVYRMFFHHLVMLNNRGEGTTYRPTLQPYYASYYANTVQLTSEQAQTLYTIALDCERQVNQLDLAAKALIVAFRKELEAVKALGPLGTYPTTPDQLKSMQQQRNMSILHHREQLRKALGEQPFLRLDGFIKLDAQHNLSAQP